ncbi:MAG: hypothetical protein O7E52_29310, partial [Candidatus Poribacteria bacterium]|nr:hypothetical protein [Candidatus Poribacteria bacterium]
EIQPGKQMFIDDFFIESMAGAHRALNRPEKITVDQPLHLISSEMPWEKGQATGAVIFDQMNQVFRMYYAGVENCVCVLESPDGIEWTRPNLGLVPFHGERDNNIVNWPDDCPAIGTLLCDPHEADEAYRWKRIHHFPHKGVWRALHSADGYDWRHYPPGPHNDQKQFFGFGSPFETFGGPIDPDALYVLYSQRGSSRRTRVLGRRDSPDFLNWSGLRTVIDQDLDDPPGTEFYSAGFDMVNRTDGGLHIIMLNTFLTDLTEPYAIEEPEHYWGGSKGPTVIPARIDGFVEPQLAVSRDTVSWKRYREPFIPRGKPGAWDWACIYAAGPIHHDRNLLFFYNGRNLTHNGRSSRPYESAYSAESQSGVGLATLRPDGYVSVEADSYAPGILTTHRFRQESGGTLTVNVDASVGELRYEVLEDTGDPIPGFTAADCDPIRRDTLEGTLSWNSLSRWPEVSEERQARYPNLSKSEFYIKLRFYIAHGTKLYSVTLAPPEVTMWQVNVKGRVD